MRKLIVELPDEVHGELKKKAAADQKTLKDIITILIYEYMSAPKKQVPIKKTGLCGIWDDERPAEEIIEDIKARRRWFARREKLVITS